MLALFLLNLDHADFQGLLDFLGDPALFLSLNLLSGLKRSVLVLDELLDARLLTLCLPLLLGVVFTKATQIFRQSFHISDFLSDLCRCLVFSDLIGLNLLLDIVIGEFGHFFVF